MVRSYSAPSLFSATQTSFPVTKGAPLHVHPTRVPCTSEGSCAMRIPWELLTVWTPFNVSPTGDAFSSTANIISQVSGTILMIIGTTSLLGIIVGALLLTTIGWTHEHKQQGIKLIRTSAIVLVVSTLSVLLVQVFLHLA